MPHGYPIVLDVSTRLIVIVGGGAVAVRKARGLLEAGATRVRVISPTFHPEMPEDVERVVAMFEAQHLTGASLVFAATDSARVNEAVVLEAKKIGALSCRADADEDHAGDFATPAMLREGELLLTVSSGGSPALSAMVRDRIRHYVDPRWNQMAMAMKSLRPKIRQKLAADRRHAALRELCSEAALDELTRGGLNALQSWLNNRYPELHD